MPETPSFIPGTDYYINDEGLWVFTAAFLLKRGYCCSSGCLHCPYGFNKDNDADQTDNSSGDFITTIDQMGNEMSIPFPPRRIISLVPSQTELLFDLGLHEEIVGITKFCIHPVDLVVSTEKIGGTKKFNLEKVHQLKPDLIIGNKEENYAAGINELQQHYPVWMSDIVSLSDACWMIMELARITNRAHKGIELTAEIMIRFQSLKRPEKDLRGAYFIWRNPYMVAAKQTFIDEMLKILGIENVFGHLARYPEVSPDTIIEAKPDVLFLSSEPFPFSEKHIDEFRKLLPGAKIMIVNGEYFSWYGSRLLQTPAYFEKLKNKMFS